MRYPTQFYTQEEVWINLALAVIPTLLVLITLGLIIVLRGEDTRLRTALRLQGLESEVVNLISSLEEPLVTDTHRIPNHTTYQVNDRVEVNGRRHVLRNFPRVNNLRERFNMSAPHPNRNSAPASTVRNVDYVNGTPRVPERTSSIMRTALQNRETYNRFGSQRFINHDDANASMAAGASGGNISAHLTSMARLIVDHPTEAGSPAHHEQLPRYTNATATTNANGDSTSSTAMGQQSNDTARRSVNSAISSRRTLAANSINDAGSTHMNGQQAVTTPAIVVRASPRAFLAVLNDIASENTSSSNVSSSSSNVSGDTLVESGSGDELLLEHSLSGDTLVERLVEVNSGPQARVGVLIDGTTGSEGRERTDGEERGASSS